MRIIQGIVVVTFASFVFSISLVGEDAKQSKSDSLTVKNTNKVENISENLVLKKAPKLVEPIEYPHKLHLHILSDCASCHQIDPKIETPSCKNCHENPESIAPEKTVNKKIPEYFTFNKDSKIFEPVTFPHLNHYEIIGDCKTCHHHHNQEDATPACKKCHNEAFDPDNIEKPGLKGAFHRKCMGCHKEYGSGPVVCVNCHKGK